MEGVEADDRGLTPTQHQAMCVELHGTANQRHLVDALLSPQRSLKQERVPMHMYELWQTCAPATNLSGEPGISESVGASLVTSSGLHGGEGSPGSHCNANKTPEFPATTWNGPKPFLSLNFQVMELANLKQIHSHTPVRVARPSADVKTRNQLLPRYRPRITDQELQSLTKRDSNSTVTPLFEKVLSASDAGKVGRLVLPKACAEAYFPPISEPEGVPLIVQDVVGREWTLQFRFWPNNNSRMYVLEGVTPCIQSMNLQAGDTVIFSRIDPEGKLVISFRRAPRIITTEGYDSVGTVLATSQRLVSPNMNGNTISTNDNEFPLYPKEKIVSQSKEEMSHAGLTMVNDKRKAKEISTKNKRQQQDAEREFRKNWEAAQNLLRSPPNVAPTIVTIEGYDFEEYEEPPVFGTQLVSADSSMRHTHQSIEEHKAGVFSQQGKGHLLPLLEREPLQQVIMEPSKTSGEYCGLQTLATLVAKQGSKNECEVLPAAEPTTTKHPRHRVGCTCIVCIQPPSGKGPKHKPNCECTVCSTVKRRFQTLMLRRKKEKEAEKEAAQRNQLAASMTVETNTIERREGDLAFPQNGFWQGHVTKDGEGSSDCNRVPLAFSSVGSYAQRLVRDYECHLTSPGIYLDLNSQPAPGSHAALMQVSMKRFTGSDGYGWDEYLKERGLTGLVCHNKVPVSSSKVPSYTAVNAERQECDSSLSPEVLSSNGSELLPT